MYSIVPILVRIKNNNRISPQECLTIENYSTIMTKKGEINTDTPLVLTFTRKYNYNNRYNHIQEKIPNLNSVCL